MNLTVKEFASRAGVSTQSVYKRLQTDLKPFATVEKGKTLINAEGLSLYEKTVANRVDNELQTVVNELQTSCKELQSQLQAVEQEKAVLQAENEALRGNLQDLREQVQTLNKRLEEAHILTANAQRQQIQLLEQKQKKPGLLARLFGGKEGSQHEG